MNESWNQIILARQTHNLMKTKEEEEKKENPQDDMLIYRPPKSEERIDNISLSLFFILFFLNTYFFPSLLRAPEI